LKNGLHGLTLSSETKSGYVRQVVALLWKRLAVSEAQMGYAMFTSHPNAYRVEGFATSAWPIRANRCTATWKSMLRNL